jgi:RluA family pseudouridine synthase
MKSTQFEILLESGPCLVVNKPGGLLTQAPPGIDSLEVRIKEFLLGRRGKEGGIYLGVPHRLDRPVSGAIVFGLHARATRRLCDQFECRSVRKTYWALVEGHVPGERATWSDRLRKVANQPRAEIVADDDPEGRTAVMHYVVLQRTEFGCWLEIELETGRMHQIRVQAASRGHPIVGDAMYGAKTPFGPVSGDERARWIALHARRIGFRHPMTREPVDVTAPLSPYWTERGIAV